MPFNNNSNDWWRKQISPGLSFIILIVFTLAILLLGVFFAKDYVAIWTRVNETKQQIQYYPEKPTGIGKFLIPSSKK